MNIRRTRTTLPLSSLAAWLLVVACSGTETDNPVVQAPDYRSPIRFEPPPPVPPGCVPSDEDSPSFALPLWGRSGNYLVGIDTVGSVPRRGLVVLDVSNPAAPSVVAEQPLAGYPRQLLVEGDSLTLVLDELQQFSSPPLPAPGALETQTKLVRFDLSTPAAPRRVAEVALDGEFWQLQAHAGSYWVMRGRLDPATQRCDVAPNLCGYVSREAMVFTRHTWSGSGWVANESVELPAGSRAWLTEAGFATTRALSDGGEQLSWVSLAADGSLGQQRTLALPGGVVSRSPLYFDAQSVALFSYDLSDGTAAFVLYALDGTELGRVRGLSQGLGAGTHFVPGGVLVAASSLSDAASFIDFSNPSAPSRVSLPQASAFLPLAAPGATATRALGWKVDASGNATTFTLWSLESSPPVLLDTLANPLPAPQPSLDLQLSESTVVFLLRAADNAPLIGSLSWNSDTLSLAGPVAGGYGDQVLAVGDWLYQADSLGLAFSNPSQGSAQRQAWDEGDLLDASAIPGGEARLALDYIQRRVQVFITRDGVAQSIAVSPGARRLLPAGERLIVLSTEPAAQCNQTGLDCTGYAPSAAILELEPLRMVAELPLPELPVPALSSQSRVDQSWAYSADITQSPVRLGEQKWLLEASWSATCLTEADCTALGIQPVPFAQANVNTGQQSCAPGVGSCPQPPPPTVYGEGNRRVSYVLDAAAGSLSQPLIVEGVRGTPYELWTRPIYSRDTLLDLHLEPSSFPRPGSPPPTSSAFLLERYVLNAAGGLDALPVINVPGYPVTLLSDTELLTLEPSPGLTGTGRLHRLQLAGETAALQASRDLDARVGEVEIVGQHAVYVRNAADSCDPVSRVMTFALDAALTPRATLELPGDGWAVIETSDTGLVLQRGRGFARVTIGADGSASIAGFATAPAAVSEARSEAGVVRAIAGNRVITLEP